MNASPLGELGELGELHELFELGELGELDELDEQGYLGDEENPASHSSFQCSQYMSVANSAASAPVPPLTALHPPVQTPLRPNLPPPVPPLAALTPQVPTPLPPPLPPPVLPPQIFKRARPTTVFAKPATTLGEPAADSVPSQPPEAAPLKQIPTESPKESPMETTKEGQKETRPNQVQLHEAQEQVSRFSALVSSLHARATQLEAEVARTLPKVLADAAAAKGVPQPAQPSPTSAGAGGGAAAEGTASSGASTTSPTPTDSWWEEATGSSRELGLWDSEHPTVVATPQPSPPRAEAAPLSTALRVPTEHRARLAREADESGRRAPLMTDTRPTEGAGAQLTGGGVAQLPRVRKPRSVGEAARQVHELHGPAAWLHAKVLQLQRLLLMLRKETELDRPAPAKVRSHPAPPCPALPCSTRLYPPPPPPRLAWPSTRLTSTRPRPCLPTPPSPPPPRRRRGRNGAAPTARARRRIVPARRTARPPPP